MNCFVGILFYCLLGRISTSSSVVSEDDMQPPTDVVVKSLTEHSFTLSWKSPESNKSKRLVAYSLTYTPLKAFGSGKERAVQLPPTSTVRTVSKLTPATQYAVILSSVYEGPVEVAAPKFTIITKSSVSDLAVGDDTYKITEDCNCSETGTIDCTQATLMCNCYVGYSGKYCEKCIPGYINIDKECKPCPCTKETSDGECVKDGDQIKCSSCLPGHRGFDCKSCTAGYKWKDEHCVPFNCYSYALCAKHTDAPGCEDCSIIKKSTTNHLSSTPHKSSSERTIADGTVPLIAVIVTLGILVLVASIATCYRYWTIRRNRPRIPFWSIELQNDNPGDCHYQHLDASTNKVIETPTSTLEAGKLYSPSSPRTYNAINV